MTKWALAFVCSMMVFAGCGGSGDTHSPAEVAAGCEKAGAARRRYDAARVTMGLNFLNKPLLHALLAATEAFRRSAAELQQVTTDSDERKVAQLVTSLSEQEKELRAFDAHNLPEARKYGNKLNIPLQEALANLNKVC